MSHYCCLKQHPVKKSPPDGTKMWTQCVFFKRKDLDKIYYNMAIFAIKVHVVEQMQISDENALSG